MGERAVETITASGIYGSIGVRGWADLMGKLPVGMGEVTGVGV
ncbi:hypothetical protein GCM10010515_00080 [Streptomyces fructofermentans]|uniref:Uncharacterized protein n=1 Tax=Streptomyces fructofermentans TaxID=152141 RepID=A0A918N574_9ACTN|nr:hypothetical protein GCM10010515_00080 [Streptomyces fructofermentans]